VLKTIGAVSLTSNRRSPRSFRRNGLEVIQHSKRVGVFAGAMGFGLTSASTTLCEPQKLRTHSMSGTNGTATGMLRRPTLILSTGH
jgi:hypothetical protein